MKNLSIFSDESGDFGTANQVQSYYLVTFVFHDQGKAIKQQILQLEDSVHLSGFDVEYIHTGPVIRREEIFKKYSIDERRKLLYKMLNFVIKCPIVHYTIKINKHDIVDNVALSGRIAKEIRLMLTKHDTFFRQYSQIIVYYDNGQTELSTVLNAVFSSYFAEVTFRKATPQQYRLLQATDFICTMELLKIKKQENRLTPSEQKFFYKPQELSKTFLKSLERKDLKKSQYK